jgi:hypothetical protein
MPKQRFSIPKPNWASGTVGPLPPASETEFEKVVRRLRLRRDNYARSEELRGWCEQNRHRCYVPESLLELWGMTVDPDSRG